MSTVILRLCLLLFLLVHHATSAPSLFGCIKGAFCGKPIPIYRLPKSIDGKELIGFMPTHESLNVGDLLNAWSYKIKAPLGSGAYLTDNIHTAEKLARYLNSLNPLVCAIYAPKEFYQDWAKIYIPKMVMVRKLNDKVRYEDYQLLESRKKLELYLELLGDSDRGPILVTDWNYDDVPNGEGFIMKISQPKFEHFSRHCYDPLAVRSEQIQLKWSERFSSDWELENDANPLYFLTEYRENGGLHLRPDPERNNLGHVIGIAGLKSSSKSEPLGMKEEKGKIRENQ